MAVIEARIVGHRSVFRPLAHFAAACLLGTLVTDIAYWRSADMFWADFSAWLVTAGLVLGVASALAGIVEVFARRPLLDPPTWTGALFGGLYLRYNYFLRDPWFRYEPITTMTLCFGAVTVVFSFIGVLKARGIL